VSNTSEALPDPDTPVTTVKPGPISRDISFGLCSRAPRIEIATLLSYFGQKAYLQNNCTTKFDAALYKSLKTIFLPNKGNLQSLFVSL
jgi:hypothetical protein